MNTCGPCSLCCKLLAIPEVQSPASKWCTHATPGKGCGVYTERPAPCQEFTCLWLSEGMPEPMRPDLAKVVLSSTTDGNRLVAYVDPGFPEAFRQGMTGRFLQSMREKGTQVIVVLGDTRKLLA